MGLIDKFNEEGALFLEKPEELQAQKLNASLLKYKEMSKSSELMVVTFTNIDGGGNFYFLDEDGNKIVLMKDKAAHHATDDSVNIEEELNRKNILGIPISVGISYVNANSRFVQTFRAGADPGSIVQSLNAEIMKEFAHRKKDGEPIKVWGNIVKIYANKVIVNIFNKGVFGMCSIREWSPGFTRSLENSASCVVGRSYAFEIIDRGENTRFGDARWILSRKRCCLDPWKTIPADIRKGTAVTVKCVSVERDKHRWWGALDFIPDIEIYGDINTQKFPVPMVGAKYICNVVDIRPNDKMFKVVPFDIAPNQGIVRDSTGAIASPKNPIDMPSDNDNSSENTEEETKE